MPENILALPAGESQLSWSLFRQSQAEELPHRTAVTDAGDAQIHGLFEEALSRLRLSHAEQLQVVADAKDDQIRGLSEALSQLRQSHAGELQQRTLVTDAKNDQIHGLSEALSQLRQSHAEQLRQWAVAINAKDDVIHRLCQRLSKLCKSHEEQLLQQVDALDAKNDEVCGLSEELSQLRNSHADQLQQQKDAVDAKDSEIRGMSIELSQLRNSHADQLQRQKDAVDANDSEIRGLSEELSQLRNSHADQLQRQRDAADAKNREIRGLSEELSQLRNSHADQLQRQRDAVDAKNHKIRGLSEELSQLHRCHVLQLQQRMAASSTQVEALDNKILELTEQLSHARQSKRESVHREQYLESRVDALKLKLESKDDEIAYLMQDLKKQGIGSEQLNMWRALRRDSRRNKHAASVASSSSFGNNFRLSYSRHPDPPTAAVKEPHGALIAMSNGVSHSCSDAEWLHVSGEGSSSGGESSEWHFCTGGHTTPRDPAEHSNMSTGERQHDDAIDQNLLEDVESQFHEQDVPTDPSIQTSFPGLTDVKTRDRQGYGRHGWGDADTR